MSRIVWLVIVIASIGCETTPAGAKNSQEANEQAGCVIGLSPSGDLYDRHARELRALIMPAPGIEESRRLAFDAFVADARLHEQPRPSVPARTHLGAYGKLQEESAEASSNRLEQTQGVVNALQVARTRLRIEHGPCHPANAR